jgi:hypothetical protein
MGGKNETISMVAIGTTLYTNYGTAGFWKVEGTTWTQLNATSPASMAASGSALYADYTGYGIWKWEAGVWTQLTPTDPLVMVAGF